MKKPTTDDICEDIAEEKNWYFSNGFYYNGQKELISRQTMRDAIAFRYRKYGVKDLDKFEEVVCEHNQLADLDSRAIYLQSIKTIPTKCWLFDWLKKEYPKYDWEQILYDIIMKKSEKIYLFYGVSMAGKSKVLDILRLVFGEFAKAMTIDQLSNKFNLGETIGKLIVIGDDLGKEDFGKVIGLIKSMATGNRISMERKFMHSQECDFKGNFVFGANNMPYFDISDDGVLRRVCVIQFTKKMVLPVKNYQDFVRDYINEGQAQALISQLKNAEFNPEAIEELNLETQRFMLWESPVYKCGSTDYETYKNWCSKKGFKPYNEDNFKKVLAIIKEKTTVEIGGIQSQLLSPADDDLPF